MVKSSLLVIFISFFSTSVNSKEIVFSWKGVIPVARSALEQAFSTTNSRILDIQTVVSNNTSKHPQLTSHYVDETKLILFKVKL
ncbi:hypothetical protein KIT90_13070 [Vibrio sp. B172a]|uniref:hypothetical protein n=1 Tax=Vibrio sp. B172a TaxID=2835790 RepID=UPI0025553506|nr:hypothetical protein [Vibrio sp. B172a]MDK9782313.1 hypothetical protein [Vibrio sp. B172a]